MLFALMLFFLKNLILIVKSVLMIDSDNDDFSPKCSSYRFWGY